MSMTEDPRSIREADGRRLHGPPLVAVVRPQYVPRMCVTSAAFRMPSIDALPYDHPWAENR
ncbi:hypothetical protein [Streptomyces sp. NPDC046942]|uniref:hypothetical protein n=1 Tax=Streptomyces sp. NPDC046942 TaxID=3155137 RepID=UPI0033E2E389